MIDRRTFLVGSAVVAGGVAFGYLRNGKPDNPLTMGLRVDEFALTPYIKVDGNGITIITPRAEMGQGVHTTLAAMVAEELDVALADVTIEHGPASEVYSNTLAFPPPKPTRSLTGQVAALIRPSPPDRSTQLTGGQTSIQDHFVRMRQTGAAARLTLLEAASQSLRVEPESLTTDDGHVIDGNGRKISYVELAPLAARIAPPQDPPLKPRSAWKLLGKSQARIDTVAKCTGSATYSIDLQLPGMLCATVKSSPRLGGLMTDFDASIAERMPGVKKIIALETGVVVVAANTWYAFRAADTIEFDWGPAPYPNSDNEHRQALEDAMGASYDSRPRDDGDVEDALAAAEIIEGHYWVPYLAHATMEPLNAVALLKNGRLDIWAGTQYPTQAAKTGAAIAGIDKSAVNVHTTYMGGGFGRRLETDFIATAVHAAKAMKGTPVKVTWSREEDMSHDVYRPTALARFRATTKNGKPLALDLKVAAPSLLRSYNLREHVAEPRKDKFIVLGAWEQPYDIRNFRVSGYDPGRLLPVGWWRSVGESQNSFFLESIMDEMASAIQVDPLAMRLELIEHLPSRKVLEAVAEMSNWGSRMDDGHARGLAFVLSSGAPTAEVIEISSTSAGIKVLKAYAAVDVGVALDPRNIEAQVQSSLVFGLTAAMTGKINLSNGIVQQSNFHDYPLLGLHQMPEIETRILENGERIFGVGESGTPAAAPALGNAIFAATGKRIRELPFGEHVRFV